jgi:hypothetical protein
MLSCFIPVQLSQRHSHFATPRRYHHSRPKNTVHWMLNSSGMLHHADRHVAYMASRPVQSSLACWYSRTSSADSPWQQPRTHAWVQPAMPGHMARSCLPSKLLQLPAHATSDPTPFILAMLLRRPPVQQGLHHFTMARQAIHLQSPMQHPHQHPYLGTTAAHPVCLNNPLEAPRLGSKAVICHPACDRASIACALHHQCLTPHFTPQASNACPTPAARLRPHCKSIPATTSEGARPDEQAARRCQRS